MQFPETRRVVYRENPLKEVACQFSFSRLFAIDENLPAQFQGELGEGYPNVDTREVVQFTFTVGTDPSSQAKRVNYDFSTEDGAVTITLTSETLLIRTSEYTRWENFRLHIENALSAFCASYSVNQFSRIGLRYVDVIVREDIGLEGVLWKDLVRHAALGFLTEDAVPIADVLELSSATVLNLNGGGKVALRAAVGRQNTDSERKVFVWDTDFFEDQTVKGKENAIAVCSKFNRASGSAFRWIITERLHDALGPSDP